MDQWLKLSAHAESFFVSALTEVSASALEALSRQVILDN
jgi:hypothetical protein